MPADEEPRRRWMAVLARAELAALEARLAELPALPSWTRLRGPEVGMIMVRGRIGGGGGPFNLGEMTVTRCTVRLGDATVGHAYIPGRAPRHAELAAVVDALMQVPEWNERLEVSVVQPLATARSELRQAETAKAAATRVQFFTMRNMR